MKALAIRQPWAYLLAHGIKKVENRTWNTKYRGPVLIHASKAIKQADYDAALSICAGLGIPLPSMTKFELGGIVGVMTITDVVTESADPFFFGPVGFVVTDARPVKFQEQKGKLSFFETGLRVTPKGHLRPEK